MDLALLVVRVVLGLLFVGHGLQKLLGAFGGQGLKGTAGMFDAIGLRPGRLHALAAGASESMGGALLALGLVTPVGAALVTAVMVAAVLTVHLPKGIWNHNGGYEFNALIVATAFVLAGVGPGDWSLDNLFDITWASTGWAIAAMAAGLVGGVGTVIAGRLVGARDDSRARPHHARRGRRPCAPAHPRPVVRGAGRAGPSTTRDRASGGRRSRLDTATKGTAHMRSRDVSAGQTVRPDHCVARRKFLFAVEQMAAHQPGPYRRPSDSGFLSAREPASGRPRAASPSGR